MGLFIFFLVLKMDDNSGGTIPRTAVVVGDVSGDNQSIRVTFWREAAQKASKLGIQQAISKMSIEFSYKILYNFGVFISFKK